MCCSSPIRILVGSPRFFHSNDVTLSSAAALVSCNTSLTVQCISVAPSECLPSLLIMPTLLMCIIQKMFKYCAVRDPPMIFHNNSLHRSKSLEVQDLLISTLHPCEPARPRDPQYPEGNIRSLMATPCKLLHRLGEPSEPTCFLSRDPRKEIPSRQEGKNTVGRIRSPSPSVTMIVFYNLQGKQYHAF